MTSKNLVVLLCSAREVNPDLSAGDSPYEYSFSESCQTNKHLHSRGAECDDCAMKWSNAIRRATPSRAGLMALILAIASGCGPSGKRTDNEPKAVSPDQSSSRPKSKRMARNPDLALANGIGEATNPVSTASAPPPGSISSVDFEATRTRAESGDVAAQTALGNYYATGQGGRIDLSQAVKWYRAAAEQGEIRAQYHLATMFAEGRGTARDDREAGKWFYKAAQQGDRMAQYSVGLMYANGQGVAADNAEANKWFQSAAQQGDAMAQLKLAMANAKDSIKWYSQAAEQGDPKALHWMAVSYLNGDGVPKDMSQAIQFYTKAADSGYALSQYNLGMMYVLGQGVDRSEAEALQLFQKAAGQNLPVAQRQLGAMYESGRGVGQDLIEAYRWYSQAAANNDLEATQSMNALAQRLTPDQIKEAETRAKALGAQH